MKLEVLVAAGALFVASVVSTGVGHADSAPVFLFDLESETDTPPSSQTYAELVMTQGPVTVTITRSSGAGFDVRDMSRFAPPEWGRRTLSPFGDANPADAFVADLSVPASEVSIEFGDLGSSDDDSPVTLVAHAGPGATGGVVAAATADWGSAENIASPKTLTVTGENILSVAFSSAGPNPQTLLWDNLAVTAVVNTPPDCSHAAPSVASVWPPNRQMVPVHVVGVSDLDGDSVAITVDRLVQDEPTDTGARRHAPDGAGVGTPAAEVRAERLGTGNGRVYTVGFTASDGQGGSCSGSVTVEVPVAKGTAAVHDGELVDSAV